MLDHTARNDHIEGIGRIRKVAEITANAERRALIVGFERRFQINPHHAGNTGELFGELQISAASRIEQPLSWLQILLDQVAVENVMKLAASVMFFKNLLA